MTIEQIRGLVSADFEAVDRIIIDRLHSSIALVDQVAEHIIHSRRQTAAATAGAARRAGPAATPAHATSRPRRFIEFIHTATLLHDDVVDSSSMRRGAKRPTKCSATQASVLVGDFVYSRAFQMMAALDRSAS